MEKNQTEKGSSEMAASLDAGLCGEGIIFPARAKEDNESLLLWHSEALTHVELDSFRGSSTCSSAHICDAGGNHSVSRRKEVDTLNLT